MTKYCYKCQETKPFDAFGRNKSKKDGLSTECRECKRQGDKAYYIANSEQVKQTVAKYRQDNPKKVAEAKKSSFIKNPDKYLNRIKSWQKANPDKIYDYNKNYAIANRGKRTAWLAKYRATKLKATPPWFEKDLVETVYQKAKEWGFAVDHVIPLQGKNVCGLHCWVNLQLLDPVLNSSKGNKV